MGKRTKGQDRDKYYHLAKDQGYRARSAFKLIEINKRHDFLSKAKVVIDLCAAPGGWCQVAAKNMPKGGIILGVDLLPIRPIPNVKTLISDITTEECRSMIKKELQTWRADVVLCDGAPNVGTAYAKDAYVQNEIALAALKVATQHLMKGGTFVTKVYRSQDYNALLWTVQQFFDSYQAVKPASSRSQSAEIFIVGMGYKDPDQIDPRMLDPKHIFDQGYEEGMNKSISVFHKKFDKHNKRHRSGYDESLGQLLTRKGTITAFIESEEPIRVLSDMHVLEFTDMCAVYKQHKDTTPEILALCSDLRILGKSDFKALLKWRLKMVAYREELKRASGVEGEEGQEEGQDEPKMGEKLPREETEEDIQAEIRDMRLKVLAEKKRRRKKEREAAAKLRQRVAMGMEAGPIEVADDEGVFSLATISGDGDLDAIREVDLGQVSDGELGLGSDVSGDEAADDDDQDSMDEDEYNRRLEEDLDAAYEEYLSTTKKTEAKEGTSMAKRAKKAKAVKAAEEEMEDTVLYDGDQQKYLEMLAGEKETDEEDSDDEDDDGYFDQVSDDEAPPVKKTKRAPGGGLLTDLLTANDIEETKKGASARWFSNALFKGVEDAFGADAEDQLAQPSAGGNAEQSADEGDGDDGDDDDDDVDDPDITGAAAELLSSMPKTDKQIRSEKRKKDAERKALAAMEPKQKEKELRARKLIAAGMGQPQQADDGKAFEIAPAQAIMLALKGNGSAGNGLPPPIDDREYGSEEEDYDDEDRARQLALGTMMLRKHRAKEILDAAYNRYTWNDPKALPEWFTDDERKHYRPQVPIPPELVAQMKEKFLSLSSKPIKKVAEARARKRKRASTKLKAAKKQANAMASNPDMSDRQKLKVIQQALKKGAAADKPTKSYVVAKKFQGGKPSTSGKTKGSKVKFVDARLRSDQRGMKRAESKKGGKRSKGKGRR
ncbi:Spb1 C-terminal domain-containing protein [Tribonema minus]|uniref:Putative rRNA methyltransferase n=1 Tax=Tribonema minus TaxID=303371 RepID=A0A835Z2H0_9STRA|nr:Spb1 C-terminal domain-containing protein [Tribonema minus]